MKHKLVVEVDSDTPVAGFMSGEVQKPRIKSLPMYWDEKSQTWRVTDTELEIDVVY